MADIPITEKPKQKLDRHIDPVCGMTVLEHPDALKAQHAGKTYYFCAPGCKRAFEKDPELYLREGPQMEM